VAASDVTARRGPDETTRDRSETDVKWVTATETRRSTKTSEFWLAIATFATLVVAGYFSEVFAEERAWTLAAIVMAAYIVSRGIAKAGSRDPEIRDIDVRR
jgi:hypothetical protein